ncbi:MAG TPA: hypothetical protein IAB02_00055 [Candidatus Pullichristensenella excrementigallinarum]|uniref:Uncharacterized protein n=1 Tax=Candidatus Pullichristensenella excrementigallinarum TaxID=2840907 RepID=A0A9D1I9V2_9FIRM|nr:hypothetical protein [Candidatus Pullichristensenella excrementigallinarum]
MRYKKVFVAVLTQFSEEGEVTPLSILWPDGRLYEIDRVLDVRPRASTRVGGAGLRYTCRIRGRQTYLFREEDRWFVEAVCS